MKILLDTHIFLWALSAPEKLSKNHHNMLTSPTNALHLSSMSLVEMIIKKDLGKLSFAFDPMQAAQSLGIFVLSYGGHDALRLEELENHHKDPFDRMIISQALNNNMAIMTVDSAFKQYPCRLL